MTNLSNYHLYDHNDWLEKERKRARLYSQRADIEYNVLKISQWLESGTISQAGFDSYCNDARDRIREIDMQLKLLDDEPPTGEEDTEVN